MSLFRASKQAPFSNNRGTSSAKNIKNNNSDIRPDNSLNKWVSVGASERVNEQANTRASKRARPSEWVRVCEWMNDQGAY